MAIATTSLLALTATVARDTVVVLSGFAASLGMPLILFVHLRLYSETFAPPMPAWFALGSFQSDLGRSEALRITLALVIFAAAAAYTGAMAFFMQQDVDRGLEIDVVKATSEGVSLLCGVHLGIFVVYVALLLLYRFLCCMLGSNEMVPPAKSKEEEPTKATTGADKTD